MIKSDSKITTRKKNKLFSLHTPQKPIFILKYSLTMQLNPRVKFDGMHHEQHAFLSF